MMHTHQRTDRDGYINVNWDNVMNEQRQSFEIIPFETFGHPYDCDSVMHYAKDQMSVNGQDTMSKVKSCIS